MCQEITVTCPSWCHTAYINVFRMIARVIKLVVCNALHYVRVEACTFNVTAPDRLRFIWARDVLIHQPVGGMYDKAHHLTCHCRVLHRPTLHDYTLQYCID